MTKPHGNVGIVFQHLLLLPWRHDPVQRDVAKAIDMKKLPRDKYLLA